jgi:Tol biopolymer transport system component
MLTGEKAFQGKSQASLVAAILGHHLPSLSTLQPAIPVSVSHVVARCLSKDPEERWQTAADLMRELMWTSEPVGDGDWAKGQAARSYSATRTSVWVLGSSILAAALGAVLAWGVQPVPVQKIARFVIADESLYVGEGGQDLAIARDGARMAYLTGRLGDVQLVVRSIDELEPTPLVQNLSGTSITPFFSPDGQWVGFHHFRDRKLMRVPTQGGRSIPICDVVAPLRGASWGTDGTIVFATSSGGAGLFRVRASGGVPEPLTTPDPAKGETGHQWPEILPGGDVVLFTILRGDPLGEAQIAALSLETGTQKVLVQGGSNPRWIPTDHILYSAAGTLFAVPFNRANVEITGDPVPVFEGVTLRRIGPPGALLGAVILSISDNGTVVYLPVGAGVSSELVWVTREGREEPLGLEPRGYGRPRISPDGRLVTVDAQRDDGGVDVWLAGLERANLARLTVGGSEQAPIWSRDGRDVIFASVRPETDGIDLYIVAADRSDDERRLLSREGNQFPYSWSPDGRSLIFSESQATTGRDIWTLELGGAASPVLVTPFNERAPAVSPDGRWMVYVSDEAGREEVYIQAYPGPGRRVQISTNGGREPVWSGDGRELFYRSLDGRQMMVVAVEAAQTFNAGPARVLFEGAYASSPPANGAPTMTCRETASGFS